MACANADTVASCQGISAPSLHTQRPFTGMPIAVPRSSPRPTRDLSCSATAPSTVLQVPSMGPAPTRLSTAIDWGSIAPLRLRARSIAEGVYAGAHRSLRKGPGVEFGGHRPYVPGDDLRWLDRRAVLRHDKLIVREFETETDRGLRLVVDASRSMAYRGSQAPASKFAYGALVAAALARVALASGDPVGLDWPGGRPARPRPRTAGPGG